MILFPYSIKKPLLKKKYYHSRVTLRKHYEVNKVQIPLALHLKSIYVLKVNSSLQDFKYNAKDFFMCFVVNFGLF